MVKRWRSIAWSLQGSWVCGADGKGNFVIDKQQMSRMVPFHDGISLS